MPAPWLGAILAEGLKTSKDVCPITMGTGFRLMLLPIWSRLLSPKYTIANKEIGVLFLGTGQNFYRDLKRYLRS